MYEVARPSNFNYQKAFLGISCFVFFLAVVALANLSNELIPNKCVTFCTLTIKKSRF